MFNKILIANRGEIACRIIKTARRMGIESVAIYSTADQNSLHVTLADSAFCIGQPPAAVSYLNIDAIISAAIASGAEALHPGYGFLSENSHLARACAAAGIIFIGPSIAAMEAMASKQRAKQMLEKTTVPLTPGYHGSEQSNARLFQEAQKLGFPVLLKAASGGGGKGMREVDCAATFDQAVAGARREALAYFADDTLLIEKLISNPRHIEMQIMADNHGHVVHLFERDCSIQRRHQKILEEAPATHLSKIVQQGLAKAAIDVARAIDYRGAGTVEFLVDADDHFYFMEMNTRLQVEHPVTEMITGLDLVEWQLRIAANECLPCTQEQIHANGHAIECRIYAEDPRNHFIPSIGQLHFLKEPTGPHLRIDSGVTTNASVTMYYDPMLAKLIAWGETRACALQRLQLALRNYHIGGIKTNLPFLQAIVTHPAFIQASFSTVFLSQEHIDMPRPDSQFALFMAASVDYLKAIPQHDSLRRETFAWQMHLKDHWILRYIIQDSPHAILVTPISHDRVLLKHENTTVEWTIKLDGEQLYLDDGQQSQRVWIESDEEKLVFYTQLDSVTVKRFHWQDQLNTHGKIDGRLTAPMPATVVAILKKKGDKIQAGDPLMVLEAMKMEHTINAPHDGIVSQVFYAMGAQVNEGAELIALDTEALQPL